MKNTVSVIACNMNEEGSIKQVLEGIPKESVYEVIVVDGASRDKSPEIAKNLGFKVIQQEGKGRGAAFRTGLKNVKGDYVIMLSTDGNERSGDITKIVDKLNEGYDLVIATRFGEGKSKDVTFVRSLGNNFLTWLCNTLTGYKLTDAQNGFRGIKRSAFIDMNIEANRFDIENEMVMKAGKMKLKVAEVPTTEEKREFGESRLNTWKDGWIIFKRILKEASRNPPYRNP